MTSDDDVDDDDDDDDDDVSDEACEGASSQRAVLFQVPVVMQFVSSMTAIHTFGRGVGMEVAQGAATRNIQTQQTVTRKKTKGQVP